MRKGFFERETKETRVRASVRIEGSGKCSSKTGIRFLDHMLSSFSTHSMVNLEVSAEGDLVHHVVEDVAIVLGKAISNALGERVGIRRFGYSIVPMDDALALASLDLVRRPYASIELRIERTMIEDAPREDIVHFLHSLIMNMEACAHIRILEGGNDHHKYEAAVKALALSFREAAKIERRSSSSSKGVM